MLHCSPRLSPGTVRAFSTSARVRSGGFVDRVRVSVKGGHGGSGCSSFSNEIRGRGFKHGPPDGGNGGRGGRVLIRSTDAQQSFAFSQFHFSAGDGQAGMSGGLKSKSGQDLILEVPAGTVVHRILNAHPDHADHQQQGEEEEDALPSPLSAAPRGVLDMRQWFDLDEPNLERVVCEGGNGGRGNRSFKNTDYRKFSQISHVGDPGEARELMLELKLIADIGLVGYPNAGKSSFLSAISRATPKIASYPFTTLHPHVGVIVSNDTTLESFTVADIPGLIDGAAQGRGLGHEFLRHIERVKVLLYVVDAAEIDGHDPVEALQSLQREVGLYKPELLRRPSLVFANKTDTRPKTVAHHIARLREFTPLPVFAGSALQRVDLGPLLDAMYDAVAAERVRTAKLLLDKEHGAGPLRTETPQRRPTTRTARAGAVSMVPAPP